MNKIELKSCPFCGGVPITMGYRMSSEDILFWVRCCGCNASTAVCNSEEAAKRAWNRRAEHE